MAPLTIVVGTQPGCSVVVVVVGGTVVVGPAVVLGTVTPFTVVRAQEVRARPATARESAVLRVMRIAMADFDDGTKRLQPMEFPHWLIGIYPYDREAQRPARDRRRTSSDLSLGVQSRAGDIERATPWPKRAGARVHDSHPGMVRRNPDDKMTV
jgi:hypothetical protein